MRKRVHERFLKSVQLNNDVSVQIDFKVKNLKYDLKC